MGKEKTRMKQADIQEGNFYVGGKRQRIREVLDGLHPVRLTPA
jgi:hypothetical protein